MVAESWADSVPKKELESFSRAVSLKQIYSTFYANYIDSNCDLKLI